MNGASILGNSVSFSCTDGYKLVGSDERICMADRQWSGVQPLCKRKLLFVFNKYQKQIGEVVIPNE